MSTGLAPNVVAGASPPFEQHRPPVTRSRCNRAQRIVRFFRRSTFMATQEVEVRFLGGPLHGEKMLLPADCEAYVHNRGTANEITYSLSRRMTPGNGKAGPVFTTEDHAKGLEMPDPVDSGRSC